MTATILVVDDLLPNIKLLEAKLTNEYYDVITAKSGFEAISSLESNAADIVLLDVMMPGMDGFETCKKIKSNPKTAHIPVVMVTALSGVEDRVQGLNCGADDFLTKPINDMALFARIKSLVRLKITLDELRLRDQTGSHFGLINDTNIVTIDNSMIMIVDDDVVQAKHIESNLVKINNAKVTTFTDPIKAFDNIIAENYDLVIVSTQLLESDGLRLCSHIKSHEKVRHVPLLILIEENDTKLIVKGLDIGVNDYIITPIESNEVLARSKTQIKRKRYQDALKSNYHQSINMAITDSLTGLYNRRYFDVHCQTLINQAKVINKPLVLLIIDIDHFKKINDEYGHLVGDEIIRQIPNRITQNVRLTDLVARYGGEEFVVVMPNTSVSDANIVAERIRSSVQKEGFKIPHPANLLNKTISIGMSDLREADTISSLIERADKALYVSKEKGRNQINFI